MAEDLQTPQPDPARFDFEKLFNTPAGEMLPDDTAGDDLTDMALRTRADSYRQGGDLNWLTEGEGSARRSAPAQAAEGPMGIARAVAMDLGEGAIEAPRQIVGGMRDAVQNTLDFFDTMGEAADARLPNLGGVTFTDAQGRFQPTYRSPAAWDALNEAGAVDDTIDLPTVSGPRTVTGGGIRSITQFLGRG